MQNVEVTDTQFQCQCHIHFQNGHVEENLNSKKTGQVKTNHW